MFPMSLTLKSDQLTATGMKVSSLMGIININYSLKGLQQPFKVSAEQRNVFLISLALIQCLKKHLDHDNVYGRNNHCKFEHNQRTAAPIRGY